MLGGAPSSSSRASVELTMSAKLVERYLSLGLAMDRHISGLVDAYYGPKAIADRVAAAPLMAPDHLVAEARALLAGVDTGESLGDPETDGDPAASRREVVADAGRDASRRHFLRSQVRGLLTTARKLAGEPIGYADEVESCYGVRPRRFAVEDFETAHRRLDEVVPGNGALADRYVAGVKLKQCRENSSRRPLARSPKTSGLVPAPCSACPRASRSILRSWPTNPGAVSTTTWGNSLEGADERRSPGALDLSRSARGTRGLSRPSRRHIRKEVGFLRRHKCFEESIVLIGTPENLIAEGLADLGLEVVMAPAPT